MCSPWWVERILRGIGTDTIGFKLGEQTLTAKLPHRYTSDRLSPDGMIKLTFNPTDAHFV
ncbi:MAG: hypothetical protein FWK04_07340 [Nostoc sp. GBBB01]|nr:hypothetical protein [Nostoc sp. GBBB01]